MYRFSMLDFLLSFKLNLYFSSIDKKSASALVSPDRQMFFGKKSPPFDFSCRRLFDPRG
jgi:hypothetical protein